MPTELTFKEARLLYDFVFYSLHNMPKGQLPARFSSEAIAHLLAILNPTTGLTLTITEEF